MGCQQKGGGALPLLVNSAVAGGDGDLIGEGGDDGHTGDVSNLSDEDQGEGDRGAGRGEAACRGGRGLMLRTWSKVFDQVTVFPPRVLLLALPRSSPSPTSSTGLAPLM